MKSHDQLSEELLARYLAETASEQERGEVEAWLAADPTRAEEVDTYRIIWEHAARIGSRKKTYNTDDAWNKVRSRMEAPEKPLEAIQQMPVTEKNTWRPYLTLIAAAAVILVVTAFGWLHLQKPKNTVTLVTASTSDQTREVTLPDGSKIFLNHHSQLTYPAAFTGETRSVSLKGEAFFDISRDEAHPFIIDANGAEVKVLGTSFNVKAYAKEPVRVDVSTGKVMVSKENKHINLVKGESAIVSADTIRTTLPDQNLLGYRTGVYDFNATSLSDVVESIRNGYHADVRLANSRLTRCRLTIRFDKEPLDATLGVIAETMNLQVRKEGETYWLDGAECP